jgi:hypothetical protein
MDVVHSAALSASDVAALLQRANLLHFLANAVASVSSVRRTNAPKHYAYGVWSSFGASDVAGPPCGVPPRPGREGGSFGYRKCLMGSPRGFICREIFGDFDRCGRLLCANKPAFSALFGSQHQASCA